MLSKLLKHEFRATGRTMLPIYGAVAALAVLANLSIRFIDVTDNKFLGILFGLVIAFFVIGIVAAGIVTAVVMISRFYRNLLKAQGYLMHTLPVTVHEQVWSKLIVALVWFAATFLVICLVILLTGLLQSGTALGELLEGFTELRRALAADGLTQLVLKALCNAVAACLLICLHFYAAMTLGHMFSRNKALMSIVFFVAISFVFNLLSTGFGLVVLQEQVDAAAENIVLLSRVAGRSLGLQLAECALLYIATVLGLKKGLNLA